MLTPLPICVGVETKPVLKKLTLAHKALAELKGTITSISNENILMETLSLVFCGEGRVETGD